MSMSVTYRVGDYLFVHAGIDPRQPLNAQTLKTLCWIVIHSLTRKSGRSIYCRA